MFSAKKDIFLYLLLCTALWTYLCLRAIYVPLVHDEAVTFFYYIHPNNFLPPHAHWDANNHILNSALASLTYDLFGNSELVLRLPNLILAIVYFYFCYKIAGLIKNRIIKWAYIFTMLTAHYFLEFFAFCRGYGISMALIVASLWYLIVYIRTYKTQHLIACLLLFFLAISANLTLLISWIIIIFYLSTNIILFKIPAKKKTLHAIIVFLLGIIPLFFISKLMFFMKENGLLYYGDKSGFVNVTLKTLTAAFTGISGSFVIYFTVSLFLIIFILMLINIFKHKIIDALKSTQTIHFILLTGNICAAILLNRLFGVNYPEDRVGLYYFPFFIGSFYFVLDDSLTLKFNKYLFILCIPFLFFPLHFLYEMNINRAQFWKNDQLPFRFYQKVTSSGNAYYKKLPPTLSGYKIKQMCWNYYNYSNGGNGSVLNSIEFPCKDADFLIATKSDFPDMFNFYDSIDYYAQSKLFLLKRKVILNKEIIDSISNINTSGTINDEFFNIWSGSAKNLKNKSIYFGFYLTFKSQEKPFESRLVVSSTDKNNNKIQYEYIQLDWLKKRWDGQKNNFTNSILVYHLPENAATITAYFWNIKKVPFSISDGKCFIYSLN